MKLSHKNNLRQKRRWRVRKKLSGTAARPRISLRITHQHVYAQCIDDEAGRTLVSVSTLAKDIRDEKLKPNLEGTAVLGKKLAEKAKAAGIKTVIFDRGMRRYHGCVKAFAEAAREGGLTF